MNKFKGMLLDDDEENYNTYARYLKRRDIEVVPFFDLPDNIEEIYNKIINLDVDFIIIDKELGKQSVSYNGLDILQTIRKYDKEIYIIFLTNNDIGNNMSQLGEFDQIIRKKDFSNEFEMIMKRLERGLSRDLSMKMEKEIDNAYKLREEYLNKQIELIKNKIEKK